MPPGVSDELVPVPESFVAVFAGIPLVVALMNPEVFRQMLALGKRLLADVAAVRPNAVRLRTHDDRLARVKRNGGHHRAVFQIGLLHMFLEISYL